MNIKYSSQIQKVLTDLDIQCVSGGYAQVGTDWHGENVSSPFARIYYILNGEAYIKNKHEIMKLSAGNCYFIPEGILYDYWCDNSLSQLFFHVNIKEPGGINLFSKVGSFAVFAMDKKEMSELFELYTSDEFSCGLQVRAFIEKSVANFIKIYKTDGFSDSNYSLETANAVKYINQNLSMQLKVSDIASYLFISESKLAKKFKAETKTSIGQYIDALVFSRAEILLSKTEQSIKSISAELGFCDQFYFSRCFQKKYGKTPLEYRKRVKNTDKM